LTEAVLRRNRLGLRSAPDRGSDAFAVELNVGRVGQLINETGHRKMVRAVGHFDDEMRTLSYAMINAFVAQHAIITETLAMRPAKLIVYLTIIASTVQKLMRDPHPSEAFRAGVRLPPDTLGYISRRGIASATGMPNENVRRIVVELIADGLVVAGPAGGVRGAGGNLQNPRVVEGLKQLFAENMRIQQIFLDAGAIDILC
jgi:hypothetical protein